MKVLVTGAAGFIGYHVARATVEAAHEVVGLDNLSDYYDPQLKLDRLAQLADKPNFEFVRLDLSDRTGMEGLFRSGGFDRVVHLAAQAGVRHSVSHPHAFLDSNLAGFLNVLEGCRHSGVGHLVFASSSSVYGLNEEQPFSAHQNVDHPLSLYAATKKANELMAHSYSHLYRLPVTGLRFFTAYGPWGRPDMATFLFTQKILAGQKIQVFNYGQMKRDFVYVEELAQGVLDTMEVLPSPDPQFDPKKPDPTSSTAPYRIYNIGNHEPVDLLRLIQVIEKCVGKKADLELLPLQAGDLVETCADISELSKATGFEPKVGIEEGITRFVEWYRGYYKVRAG
jgi:UDP-glucuronate 4-epimerase